MSGALLMAASSGLLASAGGGGGGGGGGGSVVIADHTITKIGNATVTVTASVAYQSSGVTINQNGATLETWLQSGVASDFDIRATLQSGSTPTTGTMGSWTNLASNQAWTLTAPPGNDGFSTFLIEMRPAGGGATIDSASITFIVANSQ